MKARKATGTEWPEPQTSALYNTLVRGSQHIIGAILRRSDPDLAREVATHVLLHLSQFNGKSAFSTWFFKVAKGEIIRAAVLERRRKETALDETSELASPENAPLRLPKGLTSRETMFATLRASGNSLEDIAALFGQPYNEVCYEWRLLRNKLKCLLNIAPSS